MNQSIHQLSKRRDVLISWYSSGSLGDLARAFPPSTSSPMIRHAAVCIARELRSSAVAPDIFNPPVTAPNGVADGGVAAKPSDGLVRCRARRETRENIKTASITVKNLRQRQPHDEESRNSNTHLPSQYLKGRSRSRPVTLDSIIGPTRQTPASCRGQQEVEPTGGPRIDWWVDASARLTQGMARDVTAATRLYQQDRDVNG